MLNKLHSQKRLQLFIGLILGIVFGFLLQKGGVTQYNIIIGQLLLTDFTVVKIMLTAIVTGMIGIYFLKTYGVVRLHVKSGSQGSSIIGGVIFGVGFGLLGYCPGTAVGAAAQGFLDALFGGIIGMIIGAGLFASCYPILRRNILNKKPFSKLTFPELFNVNPWLIIITLSIMIIILLFWMEKMGL
jgi:uncharacterized protein